ncbi:arabinan endo-1,5-alpha-L-arabinosidase [Kineosporia sp. J2-2]|uniref:Arabinan endo-1,5-alpha-L-arabinosidase n=1 Tax=Kineosporia corallincola TaxID=2835133 RepID=A0ABS5TIH8_9ACTN|nr:arabinan endo-1,5-alpha-L-arabinosidase [Kineosporia corallincola]MBT0770877.1 arabinan endo-1,5-alpha-L-arabinosidase [Kineosporia corallincola]
MSSVFSVRSGARTGWWRGRTRLAGLLAAALVTAAAVPVGLHMRSASAAEYPGPGAVSGNITVHDPSMVKGPDGTYLLAATAPGIALRTSTDRTKFTYSGLAFPNGASWTDEYTGTSNGNLWAPDLSYQGGKYLLYYAASSFGKNKSAIFLATSTTGKPGSFTNQGKVYSTTTSSDHNAIDPNLIIDRSGKWWLSLGSFWTGIKMIQLDPSTGKQLSSNKTVYSIASRASGSTAIEGPAIIYHAGYYFLFTSWDACCQGTSSTYKIKVGRSKTITGPYKDRAGTLLTAGGGTQILGTHGTIVGPGGQSLIQDGDGDVLVYHYYDGADNGTAKLGINRLTWDSSVWPVVS